MTLYVVFQEGVYRHACGGVYDTLDGAIAAADDMAAADSDDYHVYEVRPFELNTNDEWDAVYAVKRSEALAKQGAKVMCTSHPGWTQ